MNEEVMESFEAKWEHEQFSNNEIASIQITQIHIDPSNYYGRNPEYIEGNIYVRNVAKVSRVSFKYQAEILAIDLKKFTFRKPEVESIKARIIEICQDAAIQAVPVVTSKPDTKYFIRYIIAFTFAVIFGWLWMLGAING